MNCRVKISQWLFEESNTFLEITGAITFWHFREEIHAGILKMWAHLRTYALYFLHYRPGQHTSEQVLAAQREIFQFAEYSEKHLGGKLLTCLTHRCFAHIPPHILATLPGAFLREDFGERLVRWTKRYIQGHATVRAPQASAAVCLTQMGLRILKNQNFNVDEPLNRVRPPQARRPPDSGDVYGSALHQMINAHTGEDRDEVSSPNPCMHTFTSICRHPCTCITVCM